jgi:diguanylate cyclase (GGDEF)-like protein
LVDVDVSVLQAQFIRSFWALMLIALVTTSLLFFVGGQRPLNGRAFVGYVLLLCWAGVCRYASRFSRRWAITALALGIIPLLALFLRAPEVRDLLEVQTVGRASFGAPSTLMMGVLWGFPGALLTIVLSIVALGGSGNPAEIITATTLLALVGFSGSRVGTLIRRLENANRQLLEAATKDTLTGLGNRRKLETLPKPSGLWMLTMWDVDGLKRVNDTDGHAAGDAYLREFARALQSATAAKDELFRVGGDEFLGLHQNFTDVHALEARVKRNFPNVSVGWSFVSAGNLEAAMLEADAMLYEAKEHKKLQKARGSKAISKITRLETKKIA